MPDPRKSPWEHGQLDGDATARLLPLSFQPPADAPALSDGPAAAPLSIPPALDSLALDLPAGTDSAATEVTFLSGVTSSGTVAATSFRTWNDDSPATYNSTQSGAFKWGGSTAGSTGGTISYYFDSSSGWTAAEEAVFRSGLALWSAEANVTFSVASSADAANLVIKRGSDGGAYASISSSSSSVGSQTLGTPDATGNFVSIDTSVAGFGVADALTAYGGYGLGTVVHELGHVLGLGHAGPYNGDVTPASQQYSVYDTQLWSIMSYIDPGDTSAKYYASYSATANATDWTKDGTTYYPTTPMLLDIQAIQELYGASTDSVLTTGQSFGFNCSISGDLATFFDFTVNTTPVITLWDSGSGNTLDLSGFSTGATIDLVPGTFSSCAGLTNNLGIAAGTWINTAIGGSGADVFITNAQADTIVGGGGTDTAVFSSALSAYSLARSGDTVRVTLTATGITDTLSGVEELQFSDQSVAADSIACFAEGTRIATPAGPVAVERLKAGMRVRLAPHGGAGSRASKGGSAEVVWVGHRHLSCARHPRRWDVDPVHVRPGAFGPGQPAADLWLSPDHAVFAAGVLVPVRYLLNGSTIVQEPRAEVTYWHVELARHGALLAEGLPCESYLDTGNRGAFAKDRPARRLPLPAPPREGALRVWRERACAPLVRSGAPLAALRARLLARAEALGHARTTDPGLALEVDGTALEPQCYDDTLCLALPDGARQLVLRSRRFVPAWSETAENEAAGADTRRLGVALAELTLDETAVPLDAPRLAAGWHAPESGLRWSDGAGAIDVRGATLVALRLAAAGARYWQEA